MDNFIINPDNLNKCGMEMNHISNELFEVIESMKKEVMYLSEKKQNDLLNEKHSKLNDSINKTLNMSKTIKELGDWFILLSNEWQIEKNINGESEFEG